MQGAARKSFSIQNVTRAMPVKARGCMGGTHSAVGRGDNRSLSSTGQPKVCHFGDEAALVARAGTQKDVAATQVAVQNVFAVEIAERRCNLRGCGPAICHATCLVYNLAVVPHCRRAGYNTS